MSYVEIGKQHILPDVTSVPAACAPARVSIVKVEGLGPTALSPLSSNTVLLFLATSTGTWTRCGSD